MKKKTWESPIVLEIRKVKESYLHIEEKEVKEVVLDEKITDLLIDEGLIDEDIIDLK